MGILESVRPSRAEGAPISEEWNSEQRGRIQSIYQMLGIEEGDAPARRGGESGGGRVFLAAPDDPDDPRRTEYLLPEEDGSIGVYSEPNPRSRRIRDADEDDLERAQKWQDRARKMYERKVGEGEAIRRGAPSQGFNQLRYFPHQSSTRYQYQDVWDAPESL